MKSVLLFVLAFLLLSSFVTALGISPTKASLDFATGENRDVTLRIINNEQKPMRVALSARGDLAEFIEFPEAIITLTPDEDMKSVTYSITMPEELAPGTHTSEIVVIEIPESGDVVVVDNRAYITVESGVEIVPVLSVVQKLHVTVPFPGLFATADLIVEETDVGGSVHFTVPVSNFGTSDLEKVSGRIKILTPTYDEIAEVELSEISLKSKQKGKIVAAWTADVNAGIYIARAVIDYGKTISVEKQFSVGNLLLQIKDVVVNDFILGGVARFDVLIESLWNDVIKDVFAEMVVTDQDGNEMTRFKSAAIDVEPLSVESMQTFWDTQDVKIGTYDVDLTLDYAGKTSTKNLEIEVNIDSISTDFGGAAVAGGRVSTRDTVLIVVVAVLVLLNIFWLVYVVKRKRG